MKPFTRWLLLLILFALLLSACQSVGQAASSGQEASPAGSPPAAAAAAPSATALLPPPTRQAASPTPPPTEAPSPTPDLRLNPEDWQNWPVVPTVSARAMQIYQRGLALGNNPRAFSKIGDCQMINEAFFGIYALPGRYGFPDGYENLQDAIDYYDGMFGRISAAVSGGFVAPAILNPMWADPSLCEKGETPLTCELRRNKPSVVLIGLEFWFKGRTPESYSQYLRQIIEISIEYGAVPILITKADNVEGDHSINRATAQLAYEYDIPLWNFWLAAQSLPNRGMDAERDDGFHISVAAWNMRSFTGLQTLDAFRKAVQHLPAAE
ncbi:MAG: hypothetical protein AB1453_00250 [Chloroflexota bacterium]|jgi:hypothetical protein